MSDEPRVILERAIRSEGAGVGRVVRRPRDVTVEISDTLDAMGQRSWRRLDWTNIEETRSVTGALVEHISEMKVTQ